MDRERPHPSCQSAGRMRARPTTNGATIEAGPLCKATNRHGRCYSEMLFSAFFYTSLSTQRGHWVLGPPPVGRQPASVHPRPCHATTPQGSEMQALDRNDDATQVLSFASSVDTSLMRVGGYTLPAPGHLGRCGSTPSAVPSPIGRISRRLPPALLNLETESFSLRGPPGVPASQHGGFPVLL